MPLEDPRRRFSWVVEVLPYIEEAGIERKWIYYNPPNHPPEMEKDAARAAGKPIWDDNFGPYPTATASQWVRTLHCPSNLLPDPPVVIDDGEGQGITSYFGNGGRRHYPANFATRDGVFVRNEQISFSQIKDGTSNTLLLGERFSEDPVFDTRDDSGDGSPDDNLDGWGTWGFGAEGDVLLSAPVQINYLLPPNVPARPTSLDDERPGGVPGIPSTDESRFATERAWFDRICAFGSGHPGGANFAFCDGSVRFLADELSLQTLQALSTRAGRELITEEY